MKKQILTFALALAIALSLFSVPAKAAAGGTDYTKNFRMSKASSADGLTIQLDGKTVVTDTAPFIDAKSRTMVPVKFISEALGAAVSWKDSTKTATITKGPTVITIAAGSNKIVTNGKVTTMDTTAIIKDSRTFVPVKYIAEALGLTVGWDGAAKTVILTSPGFNSSLLAGCWETSDRGEPRRDITLNGKPYSVRVDWKALEFYPDDGETFLLWERGFENGKWKLLCSEGYANYDGEFLYLFTTGERKYESMEFEGLTTPVTTEVYPVVQPTVYKVAEWTEDSLVIEDWDEGLYNFVGKGDKPPRVW